jgi:hypothetical protein
MKNRALKEEFLRRTYCFLRPTEKTVKLLPLLPEFIFRELEEATDVTILALCTRAGYPVQRR